MSATAAKETTTLHADSGNGDDFADSLRSPIAPRPFSADALARALWQPWRRLLDCVSNLAERFLPAQCSEDLELARRARLIARFGFLGAMFGWCFALFYLLIGHLWGAGIVVVCSAGFAFLPWLMQFTGSARLAGNALCLILILGFTSLCFAEGGSEGHAIAWLVSVPLCALLLLGAQSARWWVISSFLAASGIVMANLAGFKMKPTYDAAWHPYVSAAGYLSLIVFMFLLGLIFERGRERAFARMRDALNELELTNNQLAHLNQEKNDFLGIAAHDLKNPLTVIIGTADLLKMNLPADQSARLAGNIVGAGQRMCQLIKSLLDANAIEQGRFTANLERCDLSALATECVANNQLNATRKEIVLKTETAEPAWARADRNATMQILDNLLSNAVKFSPAKATVHVRALSENGSVFIAVKDHGPGISEADQKKLFGRFTRLSAQPTGGESSTGLGLSIVKKLAEAMHGTVYCQSVLGEGATFILRLPSWESQSTDPSKRLPSFTGKALPLTRDSQADSARAADLPQPVATSQTKAS